MRLLSRGPNGIDISEDRTEPQPYVILSHTWGARKDELNYAEVSSGHVSKKIEKTLRMARRHGYKHVWIDTCCIDKTDGIELRIAINNMWQYYRNAEICYVYLADVPEKSFVNSKWFTRGWTLQELLAPRNLMFYDQGWNELGNKQERRNDILNATGIDVAIDPMTEDIATKLTWIKNRETTYPEDRAYCMMGLMDVSFPPNYGEGYAIAQSRLLEEIQKEFGRRGMIMMPDDKAEMTIETMMKQLSFQGMGLRYQTIAIADPHTCVWLAEREEYRRWMRRELKVLWIKGNPATGKSTLVKHTESRLPGIHFYFNARGSKLEHSALGMYRSLLYQLLHSSKSIHDEVLAHVRKQIAEGMEWKSTRSLQETFSVVAGLLMNPVTGSGTDNDMRLSTGATAMDLNDSMGRLEIGTPSRPAGKPLHCYVDGLDECDTTEVHEIVRTLTRTGFCILFTSRPTLPVTAVCLSLQMSSGDIELYVRNNLKAKELAQGVISDAGQLFLSAVVTVEELNKQFERGIMPELHPNAGSATMRDVFDRMVPKDDENKEIWLLCMSLLVYAKQPLSPEEFCDAMRLTTPMKATNVVDMYVATCSCGFAELISSRPARVQLIHESAREYVCGALQQAWGEDTAMRSHEVWKMACLKCLQTSYDFRGAIGDTDEELKAQVLDKHPLMSYACTYLVQHADLAEDLTEFLRTYMSVCQSPFWAAMGHGTPDLTDLRYAMVRHLVIVNATNLIAAAKLKRAEINREEKSLLVVAASWAKHATFVALLARGADIGSCDDGRTSLHAVCSREVYDEDTRLILEELLSHGVDLEAVDDDQHTALYLATEGHYQIVKTLLTRGADVNSPRSCERPLHAAIRDNEKEIVRLLLKHYADVNLLDRYERSSLHAAIQYKNVAIVRTLLKHGADVRTRDPSGRTALHRAAKRGKAEIIRLLIEKGADIDARDLSGSSALHCTMHNKDASAFELLLECGADIDAADDNGLTVLHLAIRERNVTRVRILLDRKAKTSARTETSGRTPLHYAVSYYCDPVINLLLRSNTKDWGLENNIGETALNLAWDARKTELVTQLLKPRALTTAGLSATLWIVCQYAESDGTDIRNFVKDLIDAGADPNLTDKNGTTVLMVTKKRWLVSTLLICGADTDARDNQRRTALDQAISEERRDAAEPILRHLGFKKPRNEYYKRIAAPSTRKSLR